MTSSCDEYMLESWRMFRIMSEFVMGFDVLSQLRPAVTLFGSARVAEGAPMYTLARAPHATPRGRGASRPPVGRAGDAYARTSRFWGGGCRRSNMLGPPLRPGRVLGRQFSRESRRREAKGGSARASAILLRMTTPAPIPEQLARALCSPFVPSAVSGLAEAGGYLETVWTQIEPSVRTAGFLGSALYMADMALDGAEAAYEPLLSRKSLLEGAALTPVELDQLVAVLDVFHRVQPQLLLLFAALVEAWERPRVGGMGRPEPREDSERDGRQLGTAVRFAARPPASLTEVARELQLEAPPDLYRAVAVWPGYLAAAWDELRHLVTYPEFRRRGRALYYYARSSSRFLARPLEASRDGLRERGLSEIELDVARAGIEGAAPALATMMMHCSAMRVGLGLTDREVVQRD